MEDFIFKEAKKDKPSKEIYAVIIELKESFDKIVTAIQECNKLQSSTREVDTKIDDFRIKYKNMDEINSLEQDLISLRQENNMLQG
jgi:hypothetical protein